MFMSMIAYLFLAIIYNDIHRSETTVSLALTVEIMNDIMVVYATREKRIREKLDFKSETGRKIAEIMKLEDLLKR